ncbi:hypothetical protein [Novosphingobium sp.]|uniref:hypothetical protein n=1 Tax=Novosphingobium sp. TaxID=1874826 RepID=UPI0025DB15CF|nr:hypothetical protein [Novosphingobium sp.]
MNRIALGAVSALLLAASGLFWWQGRAATEAAAPPLPMPLTEQSADPSAPVDDIPDEEGDGLRGANLPAVSEASREEKRFNRLDRNRDNLIARNEALAARVAAFRKLDTDHNNLLSFEEWAVATSNKFKKADANGDQQLTRVEFATTKPKAGKRPACKC